ncbi:DUF305 domain-containing protein, partial [Actinophytocola sp.]|uniref:DUF305 domain-containing protein n=1 Tax=Actinophytocola sp. TaxID=1872138 RepID=UPI002D7F416E
PRRLAVAATTLLTFALTACGGGDHDAGGNNHDSGAPPSASVPSDAAFNAADIAFATDMIPHHQQALEMAQIADTRATNPQVKALAARIRGAQDPEIATMSGWLREWGQPVPSSSPGMGHGQHSGMPGMMNDQEMADLMAASGKDFDRTFLEMMIRHHQGAIEMCGTHQQRGQHPQAKQLAEKIAADQAAEVAHMQDLLTKL